MNMEKVEIIQEFSDGMINRMNNKKELQEFLQDEEYIIKLKEFDPAELIENCGLYYVC